jgi:NAD(P)-dependent dehydrogenase (short-subunit alcohol dehydrogenase family)
VIYLRFKDRVVIITGSSRGLGKVFAESFAREGAKVTITGTDFNAVKNVQDGIISHDGEALALRVDVSDESSIRKMVRKTIDKFGRIDILVNNAAIMLRVLEKPMRSFWEYTVEEWDKVMAVNVRGYWLCCKAVYPQMKKQGKGKIVNLTSVAAYSGSTQWAPYVTSKGAVLSLTKTLAREMGPYNINVNGVAPGMTLTETVKEKLGQSSNHVISIQAIKRKALPLDIVGTVLFLSSDESDFISGETIIVDGGVWGGQ